MNVPPLANKEDEPERGFIYRLHRWVFLGDSAAERALETMLIELNGERYMSPLSPKLPIVGVACLLCA